MIGRFISRKLVAWRLAVSFAVAGLAAVSLGNAVTDARGQDANAAPIPLHERIDRLVEGAVVAEAAPLADDAEFLRRVTLDLTGRVPSPAETRAFLSDTTPNKRQALIDRLLAGPAHPYHMAELFDVMLMERRPDKSVTKAEWRSYLVASFQANKPWDQFSREILGADGADPALRAAAKFYLDRDGEPNMLTRDVSRMFFGMDLQCAQCHDHPLIDDYAQADYYGVMAFLTRSYVFTDKNDKNKAYFAEKSDGEAKYTSVFTKQAGQSGPRVPDGEYLDEPLLLRGEDYTVAPADNVRAVPKFSRRAELARLATNGANRAFNRNIANRLWAILMGRGLVEPVDLHHSGNPPTHPELLDLLTQEMVTLKYDMRAMLREIAQSRTYQRSLVLPPAPANAAAAMQQLATLEAEQKRLEALRDEAEKALTAAYQERDAAEKSLAPLNDELEKVRGEENKAFEASSKANQALAAAQQNLAAKQDVFNALSAAAGKTQEVAKKLPDDKELAAAAEKFVARAKTVEGEVAAGTKSVADLTAPAKAATDALVAVRQTVTAADAKLRETRKTVEPARKKAWEADASYQAAVYQAERAAARVADAKLAGQIAALTSSADATRAAIAKAQADVTANQQTVQRLTAELPKLQAEATAAQQANDAAAQALAQAKQQHATQDELAKALADAAAQTAAAQAKLPKDMELAQAAQLVKARSDKSVVDRDAMAKVVAEREPVAKTATDKLTAVQQAVATMTSQLTAAQQQAPTLAAQVKQATDKLAADEAALQTARRDWSARWSQRFFASGIRPLTPEQLAWSVMQTTGVVAQQQTAGEAEVAKKTPLTDAIKADPAQMAARQAEIEKYVQEKLAGNVTAFVNLFGAGAGQNQADFFATVDQALYFANGGTLLSWLGPAGENLTGRLVKLDDPAAIAEELYLSVFARRPTPAEVADVTQYLAGRPTDKPVALQELGWALITSAEFRFNH